MTSTDAPTGRNSPISDSAIAALLTVVSLCVYIATLCPTIFADDCGEIATAVATGGVIHPPGYPLYTLLGELFVRFIPWGEPAHRLGFLSCVCAAIAAGVTYLLARFVGAGRAWSVAGAATFAFSLSLWMQATKVETYTLNALFVALLLYVAFQVSRTGSIATFLLMAFCGGLALTNHLTIVWFIPALAYASLPAVLRVHGPRMTAAAIVGAVVACTIPLPLYLTVLLNARSHPGGEVFGDPSTLHRLFMHVSGARYHGYFQPPTLHFLFERDVIFAATWLWRNMNLMLPAGLLGLWLLVSAPARRPLGICLLLGLIGYLVCNSVYRILNIFEYYTSTVLMLSVAAAVGAEAAVAWVVRRVAPVTTPRATALVASAAVGIACIAPPVMHWTECDRSHADMMRVFGENVLNSAPPNAMIVVTGDNYLFPMWYAQEVLGERRDVTVVPRNMFLYWGDQPSRDLDTWAAKRIQKEHPETNMDALIARATIDPAYGNSSGQLWDTVNAAIKRGQPVYFTDVMSGDMNATPDPVTGNRTLARVPGETIIFEGLMGRLVNVKHIPTIKQQIQSELQVEQKINYEFAPPNMFALEPDADITNVKYGYALNKTAKMLIDSKDYTDAYERANRAFILCPNNAVFANTYAFTCMMTGRTDDAIAAWREAIALDPGNADYALNLQTALQQTAASGKRP